MPGLIVVAGQAHAEERAKRMARPLLRRPWEHVALGVCAEGSVALGYVGERGGLARDDTRGCVLAFAGELHGPPSVRTGDACARELLSLYLKDGSQMSPPEGCFTVAIWDDRLGDLVLLTDRFADQGLYLGREGCAILAAGELKALVAGGYAARLDVQGAAESLLYGFAVSDHSLLAGIRLVPAATTLVFGRQYQSKKSRWHYAARPLDETRRRIDDRELAKEFGRLLERSVERIVAGDTSLALSGGFDSRCLAAALSRRGFSGLAATHGRPGSREGRLAARVARRAGLRHRAIELEPGFMARGAPACVWLSDGRKVPFSSHGFAFRRLRDEEGARALLTGTRGDCAVRTAPLPPPKHAGETKAAAIHRHSAQDIGVRVVPAMDPRFAADFSARTEGAVARAIDGQDGDAQALLARVRFLDTGIESAALYDDHLAVRSPYLNAELAEFCGTLPYRLRFDGGIQRAYLRRHPSLARLSTWNQGVPPSVPDMCQSAACSAVRLWRRAHTRLSAHLPGPVRTFSYAFYADVLSASHGILSLLLEDRTLDRRQIRPAVVHRLIAETTAGRATHVSVLARLLRLELFQRQFVDGDGAPAEPEA